VTEHTPGPWGLFDGNDIWPVEADGDIKLEGGYVARVRWRGHPVETETGNYEFPETAANAMLIAAAPSLLEAAKEVLRVLDESEFYQDLIHSTRLVPTFDALRAAIAAAEGVQS